MTNKTEKVAPKSPLKILLLENNLNSSLKRHISESGVNVEITVATDKYDFLRNLIRFLPEIILLKDGSSGFPIRDAFYLVRETYPMVPVFGIEGSRLPSPSSDAPGPGTPSDINWLKKDDVVARLQKVQLTKEPATVGQIQLARMRVVRQIKSNISGLKAIRQFLIANEIAQDDWAGNVAEEIDHSIEYLTRLHENLRIEIQADRPR